MENTLTPMTETTTPVTDISASSTDIPVVTNEKIVMAATRGWAHPKWYPMADTMSTETQMPITTTVTEIPNTMNTTTTEAPIISENRGEYVQPGAIRVTIVFCHFNTHAGAENLPIFFPSLAEATDTRVFASPLRSCRPRARA